jgi:hypothetical protein
MQTKASKKGKRDVATLAFMELRTGKTPEDRLRWVVEFTQKDLEALRREERVALGLDLLMLATAGWAPSKPRGSRGGHQYTSAMPLATLPDDLLSSLQAEMAHGLQSLLIEPPQPWDLPAPETVSVSRISPPGAKKAQLAVHWEGGVREAILGSVLTLLLQAGDALRACATCGRPLVARKRQIYCSPVCSQKVRDRNRPLRPSRAKA